MNIKPQVLAASICIYICETCFVLFCFRDRVETDIKLIKKKNWLIISGLTHLKLNCFSKFSYGHDISTLLCIT